MIRYSDTLDDITPAGLAGFFGGWSHPPSPDEHLAILKGSDFIQLALDSETQQVIGYVTAISDGVSCAYVPHLEVLERYRKQGIATELVRRLLATIDQFYMVDLICDDDLHPFYERLGFRRHAGMIRRNYERQSCE